MDNSPVLLSPCTLRTGCDVEDDAESDVNKALMQSATVFKIQRREANHDSMRIRIGY